MFKNKSKDEILELFEGYKYQITTFLKDEIIALEDSYCKNVGLVIEGEVDIKRMLTSNSTVHLASFYSGDLFGEVVAFSDINKYPATVMASSKSEVMFIDKHDFVKFCTKNPEFLEMFLNDLTNKILKLNKSITSLSLTSIRQKVSNYLINEYKAQNSNYIMLNMTKQKLSEVLGIPRPSLSREFSNLKNLGVIDYSKDFVKILNVQALENFLTE